MRKIQDVGWRGGEVGRRQHGTEPLEGLRTEPQAAVWLSESSAHRGVCELPASRRLTGMGSGPIPSLPKSHRGQEKLPGAPCGPLFLRGNGVEVGHWDTL